MKATHRLAVIILSLAGLVTGTNVFAGNVEINDPWVREAPPNAQVLAAYMTIANNSAKTVSLMEVQSPAFDHVEMHRSMVKDGMMHMMKQDSIEIPAGGKVMLQPGGYHLMLMKPKHALKAGDKVSFTLKFNDGSRSDVNAPVKKATGGMDMNMDHSHSHDDNGMHHDVDMHHDM
jgi:copper(I)-binding protein